jgi:hypothetical protein
LDNLVYEDLVLQGRPTAREIAKGIYSNELDLSPFARIEWLKLQPHHRRCEPQPWMQLSKVLESRGDHESAKRVIREFQRVKASKVKSRPLRWFRQVVAQLEESPSRILYSISVSLLLGCLVFFHAGSTGALAPTEAEAYKAFTAGRPAPAAYPALSPFIYTLENALPLVRLGQDDKWAPDRNHPATDLLTHYWFLMWVRWSLILFGWFQATVLAAALASRFKP